MNLQRLTRQLIRRLGQTHGDLRLFSGSLRRCKQNQRPVYTGTRSMASGAVASSRVSARETKQLDGNECGGDQSGGRFPARLELSSLAESRWSREALAGVWARQGGVSIFTVFKSLLSTRDWRVESVVLGSPAAPPDNSLLLFCC